MKNHEKIFDYYMFFVYLFLLPFSVIFSILYFFYLDIEMVDDFFVTLGLIGIIISVLIGIICFAIIFNFLKKSGNFLDFFKVFGAYLIFLPVFLFFFIGFTNTFFDNTNEKNREVEIIYKNENRRYRRGQKRERFYIYAKSWKKDLDRISISVDRYSFQNINVGDRIQVKTRNGFWGFEYIDFSK